MDKTVDKVRMKFTVRPQQDPKDATKSVFVPAIVDRADPLSLATVVHHAIDTGRIAGLKTSAAKGIANGICDQIYQELLNGKSIAFEKYFYISLFLGGTVADATATLTDDNPVNVRIRQGNDFRVALDDYTWSNTVNDLSAKIEYVTSADGVRGEIKKGATNFLDGTGFGDTAEGLKVTIVYDEDTYEGTITSVGPNRLGFTLPASMDTIPAGSEVSVMVTKTVDETDYVSNAKSASLVAGA